MYSRASRWKLPPALSLVLFWEFSRTRLAVFVITRGEITFRELSITPIELSQATYRFVTSQRRDDGMENSGTDSEWRSAMLQVGRLLGDQLFRPIEDLLQNSGSLAIIPGFTIASLPLHLAALTESERLLDRFDITYYLQLLSGSSPDSSHQEAQSDGVFIASYSPAEARLPFGVLEARAIEECYAGGVLLRTGDEATPEAVLEGLAKSRLAHLCCHGSFDWESPLDSELHFAGRNLTLREIALSLSHSPCDVIILSACEAGARIRSEHERSDFASTLLRAGCRLVISADWRIDDLSTAVLMERLHREIAGGTDPAAALAVAQRGMRTETAGAIAARVRHWLSIAGSDLTPPEQAYVTEKIALLDPQCEIAVFAHPVYWGYFSATADSFQLGHTPERGISLVHRD